MPQLKKPLSVTAHTRLLAALPSKAYVAIFMLMGKNKAQINDLSRSLLLQFFLDEMQAHLFMEPDELEAIKEMIDIPQFDFAEEDWVSLAQGFKALGEADPNAYIINVASDLKSL